MTKAEFEAAVDNVRIDAEIYFQTPGHKPLQLVNCHKELPNTLVLGYSPLGLWAEFECLGEFAILSPYYHAPLDTELIVRIEGKEYQPTRVEVEDGKILLCP